MRNRIRPPLFICVIFLLAGWVLAQTYPRPIGLVNDFADLISADSEAVLENKLETYREKTGIEFAVITVNSLGDLPIEMYSLELAESWGVGDRKKDNGIILLVAPNERKVRIETGYGIEPDLPDGKAGRIIREFIIPEFKADNMEFGILKGVDAIIDALGTGPYEERLEERKKVEAELKKRNEQLAKIFLHLLGLSGLVALFVLGTRCLVKRKKLAKKLRDENGKLIVDCQKMIEKLLADNGSMLCKLESLQKKNPREAWQDLKIEFPAVLLIEHWRDVVGKLGAKHPAGNPFKISKSLLMAHKKLTEFSRTYDAIDKMVIRIQKAREYSSNFILDFGDVYKKVELALQHSDVLTETRGMIIGVQQKFAQARRLIAVLPTNWIMVSDSLHEVERVLIEAKKQAEANKLYAKEAREKGPGLLDKLPETLKETEEKLNESNASSKVKEYLQKAEKKLEEAQSIAVGSEINWVAVYALLAAVAALIDKAVKQSKEDKKRPTYSPSRREYGDDSPGGGYSYGYSSPSRESGGSGGFGGGSFGGGGATGSW